jgi:hypothetical protein
MGKLVEYRFFGRITRIESTLPGHSSPTVRALYSWSEPFENVDPLTSCAAIVPERWQDRNADGRWDTWEKRIGPDASGECSIRYEIASANSTKPQWSFTLPFGDHKKAEARMRQLRGF